MEINQVLQGDCLELMKQLPDKSVDAVITDPPYGIGVSHWDTVIDIAAFTAEVKRVSKDFYCFFGQMPTVVNWINEANNQKMKYREHITWVKRNSTPSARLSRCQESIFIYGDRAKFYETRGPYEDVKIPGILFDTYTVQSFQRAYSGLIAENKSGEQQLRKSGNTSNACYDRFRETEKTVAIAPETVNFSNVWSFLPPKQQKRDAIVDLHPTEKPIEIMKRLVEMLVPDGGIILDPFAGSGTTAIAALNTGRNYILMEKETEYIEVIHKRIANHTVQLSLAV